MGEVVQVPKEVLDELAAALWGEDRKSDSPVVLLNSAADELRVGRTFNQPLLDLERAVAEVPPGAAAEGPAAVTKAAALVRRMLEHLRAIAVQTGAFSRADRAPSDRSGVRASSPGDLDVDVLSARILDQLSTLRSTDYLRASELRVLLSKAELSPYGNPMPGEVVEMLGERFVDLIQRVRLSGDALQAVRVVAGLEAVALIPVSKPGVGWRDYPVLDETVRTVERMRKQKGVDDEAWNAVTDHLKVSRESGWRPVVEAIDAAARVQALEVGQDFVEALDRLQGLAAGGGSPVDLKDPIPTNEQVDAVVEVVRDRIEALGRDRDQAIDRRDEARLEREQARKLAENFQAELLRVAGELRVIEAVLDEVRAPGSNDTAEGQAPAERIRMLALERDDAVRREAGERTRALKAEGEVDQLREAVEAPEGGPPPAEPRGLTWRDRYQRLSSTHNAAARELYTAAVALGGTIPEGTISILAGASRVRELAQLRAKDLEKGRITAPALPTDAALAVAFLDHVAGVIASSGYQRSLDRAAIFAVDEGQVLRVEIDGLLGRVMRDDVDEETIQELVTALAFLEAADGEPDRYAPWAAAEPESEDPDLERRCRVCGCTDDDCRQCVEKTGEPCRWVEADLCSACQNEPIRIDRPTFRTFPKPGEFVTGLDFGGPGGLTARVTVEALADGRFRVVDVGYDALPSPARPEEEELEEAAEDPQVPIGATPRKFRVEGSVLGGDPDSVVARVTAGIAEVLRVGGSAEGRPVDEVPEASDPTNPR